MSNITETRAGKNLPAAMHPKETGLRALLSNEAIKKRFDEVLGKEGPVFAASILNAVNSSRALQECELKSILNAGFQAAAMKLPITPGLGQAAIVPYKDVAQFQIMVRGYIQLAHRSGQYRRINLAEVHEGELIEHNEFTGEVKLDASKRKSDKVIGYYFFFELINGYRHEAYWTVERCLAHGKKYSQAYKAGKGPWVEMPEVMCRKTVVKNEIAKWGPLSTEMRLAIQLDQAAIKDDGTPDYIDSTAESAEERAEQELREPQATDEKAQDKTTAMTEPKAKPEGNQDDDRRPENVKSVASTEVEIGGKKCPVFVIRFINLEGKKFYSESEAVSKLAQQSRDKGFSVLFDSENREGLEWIVTLAKASQEESKKS